MITQLTFNNDYCLSFGSGSVKLGALCGMTPYLFTDTACTTPDTSTPTTSSTLPGSTGACVLSYASSNVTVNGHSSGSSSISAKNPYSADYSNTGSDGICYVGATTSSKKSTCFAGSETLVLESGEVKQISDIRVGDKVMVTSINSILAGSSSTVNRFSEVIVYPHAADNTIEAKFTHITTIGTTGVHEIKLTPDHLVLGGSCDNTLMSLVTAASLTISDCLQTVNGKEKITAIDFVQKKGIYTVVVLDADALLVVNGIVASSFGSNHAVANAFYNIHRFFYRLSSAVLGDNAKAVGVSVLAINTVTAFGDLMASAF